ncbi:MAG: DNA topoisomerase IV subunit A [Kiritimatiellia bacterium]
MKRKVPQPEFSFDAWADPPGAESDAADRVGTPDAVAVDMPEPGPAKPVHMPPPAEGAVEVHAHGPGPLRAMMDSNFLEYASYVICDRAIPAMEDGLKPVQRRILWSVHENDDGRFTKVANIVGHCMQYHPHGDASIADALVNLTNKRYLIEGQGNFGNPFTGDPAAASRYIECRLTDLARKEIFNDDLTPFVSNYDGRRKEPVTLPSKLPLLLMLGAEGIAVGMSTRLLPHNFCELIAAQIAVMQKKPFTLYPDFFQGGLMDVSEYNDGNGKVKLRARFDQDQRTRLVIREVPYGTTTESIISSIEDAVRKKKVPVRAINDFTAENVEIELLLSPGTKPDNAIQALYAFTACESSISTRAVVIRKNRPVDTNISEILRENTDQTIQVLRQELELRKHNLQESLQQKTLVQIFIENRIYKAIESCKTAEAVRTAIYAGLEPFKERLLRPVSDDDIEMLLGVRIRRISLFDIEKHRKEIEGILKELEQIEKNLKQLKRYVIKYLENLLKTYGQEYPRKTAITTFGSIEVRELTATELKINYDAERGYIGHGVNGETLFACSSYDKIVVFSEDGRYWVMSPPERFFVVGGLQLAQISDRDAVYTLVYTDQSSGFTYLKRFSTGGTIMDKEYRCATEASKVLVLEDKPIEEIYVKYKPAKAQRIHQQAFQPQAVAVKGAKAKGNQMTSKGIARIATSKPRWWDDEAESPRGQLL